MTFRQVLRVGFAAVLIALFIYTLGDPLRPAEASAALAVVDACHTGDLVAAHQTGELEAARLPLHGWVVGVLAGWKASGVDVGTARAVSFLAMVLAAIAGAAAFGPTRLTTPAIVIATPAIWSIAIRGTPAALLALCVTLALAAYEAGRRLESPTLRWVLPPILGAAASLVWSPAGLFVGLALLIEALRLAGRDEVAWFRLSLGTLAGTALVGIWQIAWAGFVVDAPGWWARVANDLLTGDATLAARSISARVSAVAGVLMPAVVLAIVGGWPPYLVQPRTPGETRLGRGTVVVSMLAVLAAIVLPAVPAALVVPASIATLAVLGRGRLVSGPPDQSRRVESAAVAVLILIVAFDVLHTPRRGHVDLSGVDRVPADAALVADRDLDPVETWDVVSRLGRPVGRGEGPGDSAWFVRHDPDGPGLSVDGPVAPEAWSQLGRPLTRATPPAEAAAGFEEKLAAARASYEADPTDVLSAIWIGRYLAYLGRYGEAIDWYGDAIQVHPEDVRLWRHLGHRFISVRGFESAIAHLEQAVELEEGKEDRVEPDGLPNALGIPLSTTQTNIWYHLGLAHYLRGDMEKTASCYRRKLELSRNDDGWVSGAHWLHIALRRLGRHDEAAALLEGLRPDMEIIENHSYYDLVRLYAGEVSAEELQQRLDEGDGPSQAALAYGLARWYEDTGDVNRAVEAYRAIVGAAPWAAFGTIAAEAELTARARREIPVW